MLLQNLKELDFHALSRLIEEAGWPRYRANQIFNWIYQKGVTDFGAMTDLSKQQRAWLAERAHISRLEVLSFQEARDGTRKYLFGLADGLSIETVLIPDEGGAGRRLTLCISSQVGCTLDCGFCLTGRMGLARNLKPHEIADQVLSVRRALARSNPAERLTHIVLMGMGEPLANFHAVIAAIRQLSDPRGLSFPQRRITISTAGFVPQIRLLGTLGLKINLAVSINAADDETRNRIMGTINRKYPLKELLKACREFPLAPHRRLTFEYVLLKGINDGPSDATRLSRLVKGIRCKINLIPYNAYPGGAFERPSDAAVLRFQQVLTRSGLLAFIRKSKGGEILAACGQLESAHAHRPPAPLDTPSNVLIG